MISPRFPSHPRIPAHAECVFSGVRSEIYQWQQEMYDNSYRTFEMIRFLDGAFVIAITPEGRILLTRQEQPARAHPFLGLPGGSFDTPDEDPLVCAQRELLEESGYVSDEWELWHVFDGTGNVATCTYFYIARDTRRVQDITPDGGEKIQLFDVSFDEFLELSSDTMFHHHWSLIPLLYEARINPDNYSALKKKLYKK